MCAMRGRTSRLPTYAADPHTKHLLPLGLRGRQGDESCVGPKDLCHAAGSVNGRNMMQQFLYKPGNAALLSGAPGAVAGTRGVSPSNAGPPDFSNFAENALAAMSRVSSGSGAGLPAPPPPTQQKVCAARLQLPIACTCSKVGVCSPACHAA